MNGPFAQYHQIVIWLIAANFGIIGMGTDTGNSIRGPASHLSLVGIRSTIGATSRDGIVPLLLNRDVGGPLMRTVRDTGRCQERCRIF
ncbi:MAG: hypothetical protein GY794_15055 [bacterium]|nr:hypothetical protein [bacterium]